MSEEPYGHRGHPTQQEIGLSLILSGRLGVALAALSEHGFSHREGVSFISGAAWELGNTVHGETWSSPDSAKNTVEGLLFGRSTKMWAIGLITVVLDQLKEASWN